MILGQQTTTKQPPKMPPVGDVITTRHFSALTNVIVFTPYAVYLARGKKPPNWLIAASLAFLAVSFFEDMRYLFRGEQVIEAELMPAPPTLSGLADCGCSGLAAQPTPRPRPRTAQDAWRYRVNR